MLNDIDIADLLTIGGILAAAIRAEMTTRENKRRLDTLDEPKEGYKARVARKIEELIEELHELDKKVDLSDKDIKSVLEKVEYIFGSIDSLGSKVEESLKDLRSELREEIRREIETRERK